MSLSANVRDRTGPSWCDPLPTTRLNLMSGHYGGVAKQKVSTDYSQPRAYLSWGQMIDDLLHNALLSLPQANNA